MRRVIPITVIAVSAVVVVAGMLTLILLLRSSGESHEQAQSFAACERGNELRGEVFLLAQVATHLERPDLVQQGEVVSHRMESAPFANSDGTIDCAAAVVK